MTHILIPIQVHNLDVLFLHLEQEPEIIEEVLPLESGYEKRVTEKAKNKQTDEQPQVAAY